MANEFDFSKLAKSIEDTTKKIFNFEKGFSSAISNMRKGFSSVPKSSGLDAFAKSIQDSQKDIQAAIKSIDTTLKNVTTKGGLGGTGRLIEDLIGLAESLDGASINSSAVHELQFFMIGISEVVSKIKNLKSVNVSANSLKNIVFAIKGISSIGRSIRNDEDGTLKASMRTGVLESIDFASQLINKLSQLASQVKNVKSIGTLSNAMYRIASGLRSFTELAKISEQKPINSTEILRFLFSVTDISNGLSRISKGLGNTQGLGRVATAIKDVSNAIPDIQDAAQNMAILDLPKLFIEVTQIKRFLASVSAIATGLSTISKSMGSTRGVGRVSAAIKDVAIAIPAIQDVAQSMAILNIPKVAVEIAQLTRFLTTVGVITKSLSKIASNIKVNPEKMRTIGASLKAVSSSMQEIMEVSFDLAGPFNFKQQIKQWIQIGAFINVVKRIASAFGKISSKIENPDALRKLALAMKDIGRSIGEIMEEAQKISTLMEIPFFRRFSKEYRAQTRLFQILGRFAREIDKIAGKIKNVENLDKFRLAIVGISTLFKDVQKMDFDAIGGQKLSIFNPKRLFGGDPGALGKFVKLLKPVINALKPLKNVTIPDFGALLKSLRDFSQDSSEIKFKNVDFSGFNNIAQQLKKNVIPGLKSISKEKIGTDTNALKSILDTINIANKSIFSIPDRVAKTALKTFLPGNRLNTDVKSAGQAVNSSLISTTFLSEIKQGFTRQIGGILADGIVEGLASLTPSKIVESLLQSLEELSNKVKSISSEMKTLAQDILQVFDIRKFFNSKAITSAADFDQLSSQLKVFGGLTQEQLKRAQEFSNQIGIDYPLSANQALAATLDLIKAGQDLSKVEFILPSAADLASLSESGDLDNVTKFLITAANGYEKFSDTVVASFEGIDAASDIVFQAANVSTASVDGLIDGLSRVAPSAKAAGLTLEETAAFLTIFEDAGIRGTEAGTQLATVLDQILKAGGNKADLERLINSTSSVTDFGDTFAQRGLRILRAGNDIDSITESMTNAGSASKAASDLLDNFKGDLLQLGGSIETFLAKAALPLLSRFFRPFIKLARVAVDGMLQLPDVFIEVATNAIFLTTVVASLFAAFLIGVGTLLQFSGAILGIAGAIGTALVSLPTLVIGITALTAAAAAAVAIFATFTAGITAFSYYVTSVFRVVENNVGGAGDSFNELRDALSKTFSQINRIFSASLIVIKRFFGTGLGEEGITRGRQVAAIFDQMTEAIEAFNRRLDNISTEKIIFFFAEIRRVSDRFIRAINDISGGIFGVLAGNKEQESRIKTGLNNLFSIFAGFAQRLTGIDFSKSIALFDIGKAGEGVKEFVSKFIDSVKQAILQNRSEIENIFEFAIKFLNPFNKAGSLLTFLGFNELGGALNDIGDALNSTITKSLSVLIDLLGGKPLDEVILGQFGEKASGVADAIRKIGKSIEPLIQIVENAFETISNIVGDFGDLISGDINLSQFGSQIVDSISSLFSKIPRLIGQSFSILGEEFQSEFFTRLGFAFKRGDIFEIGQIVLGKLFEVVGDVVRKAPDLFLKFGKEFNSSFLTGIGTALQQGDAGSLIGIIGGGILNVLGKLGNFVATSLIRLGEELNVPFLSTLAQSIVDGDLGASFIILSDGIKQLVQSLFRELPVALSEIGKQLKIQALIDIANLISPSSPFGKALTWLSNILSEILSLPLSLIGTAIGAITNFVNAVKSGDGAAIATVFVAFDRLARILGGRLLSNLSGFVGILQRIGTFAATLVIMEGIQAALEGIRVGFSEEGGAGSGVLAFFESLTTGLLELVGLTDHAQKMREIFDQLPLVISYFVDQAVLAFAKLRADAENTFRGLPGFDTSFRDFFRDINSTFEEFQSGAIGGFNLFDRIAREIDNPRDRATLNAVLRDNTESIFSAFNEIASTSGGLAELTDQQFSDLVKTLNSVKYNEDISLLGKAFQDLSQDPEQLALFQQRIESLTDIDVTSYLTESEQAIRAFKEELRTLNFAELTDEARSDLASSLQEQGVLFESLESILEEKGSVAFRDFIKSVFKVDPSTLQGIDLSSILEGFTIETVENEILSNQLRDGFKETLDNAVENTDVSDDAKENLKDKFFKAVDDIAQEGITVDSAKAIDEFINEFDKLDIASREEVDLLKEAAINIFASADGVKITRSEAEILNQILGSTSENSEEFLNSILSTVDSSEDLLRLLEEGKITLDEFVALRDQIDNPVAGTEIAPTINTDPALEQVSEFTEELTSEFEDAQKEISETLRDIAKKEQDFQIDEGRKQREDEDKVREQQNKIVELEQSGLAEREKEIAEFQLETTRNEQDFRNRLKQIDQQANDTLEDAAINRDAAAAQAAIKERDRQKKEETDKFNLDEARRQEDFILRQQEADTKRQQELVAAQVELQDLITKNELERQERLFDHQRELEELRAKHSEQLLELQTSLDAETEAKRLSAEEQKAIVEDWAVQNSAMVDYIKTKWINAAQVIANSLPQTGLNLFGNLLNGVQSGFNSGGFQGALQGGLSGIANSIGDVIQIGNANQAANSATDLAGDISGAISDLFAKKELPSFNTGGYVSRTGLAKVDKGERVLNPYQSTEYAKMFNPSGVVNRAQNGSGFGGMPPITVNIDMSGMTNGANIDPAQLADMVEDRVMSGVNKSLKDYAAARRNI